MLVGFTMGSQNKEIIVNTLYLVLCILIGWLLDLCHHVNSV